MKVFLKTNFAYFFCFQTLAVAIGCEGFKGVPSSLTHI